VTGKCRVPSRREGPSKENIERAKMAHPNAVGKGKLKRENGQSNWGEAFQRERGSDIGLQGGKRNAGC